jgi:hypothetical protein
MTKTKYDELNERLKDVEKRLDNIDSLTFVEVDGKDYPISRVHAAPAPEMEDPPPKEKQN